MSSNILRPTFSSGEKRKARALRQSLSEVNSFGFSSCGSPFAFSPDVKSTISATVVKRFLQNNDDRITEEPPKSSNVEGTPLFASKHSNLIAAAGHEGALDANMNVGLFGYSCSNDDASAASPLRRINGRGGNTIDALNQALPLSSSAAFDGGAINERACNVKKRLKYSDDSCVDLTALQVTHLGTDSPKILSSSSNDDECGSTVCSNSEMDDGTVHEDWIIEDDEETSSVKGITSGIEVLDASFIIWAGTGTSARANLGQTE